MPPLTNCLTLAELKNCVHAVEGSCVWRNVETPIVYGAAARTQSCLRFVASEAYVLRGAGGGAGPQPQPEEKCGGQRLGLAAAANAWPEDLNGFVSEGRQAA